MTDFYWNLFTATGDVNAYLEYRNCYDRIASNAYNNPEYINGELNENFSRQWYRSEDYCGW